MATEPVLFDLDLDNQTLDDLPDLPSYVVLHTGAYKVRFENGVEVKDVEVKKDGRAYISKRANLNMTVLEVLEVSEKIDENAGEKLAAPNDIASVMWTLDTETGVGFFKKGLGMIAAALDLPKDTKLSDIITVSKGMDAIITVKREVRTDDKTKHRFNIVTMVAA